LAKALTKLLAYLDSLPPIRLPIGSPVPWRIGLPVAVVALAVFIWIGRPNAHSEDRSLRLPSQETYAVQTESPLFADSHPALGVTDPPGTGFDILDLGFKFVLVLGLAYVSLHLLKRANAARLSTPTSTAGLHVVSSLSLAPNRSVHVLQVPGGKTLLVGATPNQVNLIADLGEVSASDLVASESGSFLDILGRKLSQTC
jgi:flagellar biogenesis protein FliO